MTSADPTRARRSRFRDPRVWFGLAVTVFFMWLALRGVPFAAIGEAIAGARWGILLVVSVPALGMNVLLRALRWRHLTDPIQRIDVGPLFRATSVGFMANNIFPLRMGEVVRSWYLAREVGASAGAIFGTVVLERVLDIVAVVGLAFVALGLSGLSDDGAITRRALLLLPLAIAPTAVLVALRAAPTQALAVADFVLRPFPERFRTLGTHLLERFTEGLGALRGGRHLFWIAAYTLGIWLVASPLALLAGFWSLDLSFGSLREMLIAAWVTQAAVGVAVALPSAPGFFGPYHYACKAALVRFGVTPGMAIAVGTLTHAVFWLGLTALGLIVLRLRQTSLGETLGVPVPAEPLSDR